jgi:hypothetical protein
MLTDRAEGRGEAAPTTTVLLGDTTLAHMTAVPASVFANGDVRLRVWFNDGTHGFELLVPDQRVAAVGYALAANVADGSVTAQKLAPALDADLARLNSSPTFTGIVTAGAFAGDGSRLTNLGVGGGFAWEVLATSGSAPAQPNHGYIAASATSAIALTLPVSPSMGDIVRVSGKGAGGWRVVQNDGQAIIATAFGGSVTSQLGWLPHGPDAYWRDLASSTDGVHLVAATANNLAVTGEIYISHDGGLTWTASAPASLRWYSVASSANGRILAAIGWDSTRGMIHVSADAGVNWTQSGLPAGYGDVAISADGTRLFAVGDG